MKRMKKKIFVVCMFVLLAVICGLKIQAQAVTVKETLIPEQNEYLESGSSKEYEFTVSQKSKIRISFVGDSGIDEGYSCGNYELYVEDANGKEVYRNEGKLDFDDQNLDFDLDAGKYNLVITAPYDEMDGIWTDYDFYVTAEYEDKEISKKNVELPVGGSQQLRLLDESNSYVSVNDSNLTWETTNANVANVDKSGKITAVTPGTATVSAVYGGKSYSCKVSVKAPVISKHTLTLQIGQKSQLKLGYTNGVVVNGTASHKLTWKTSNAKIASVDQKGNVTSIIPGTAIISAVYCGESYSCKVTVKVPVMSKKTLTLQIGQKSQLKLGYTKGIVVKGNSNHKLIWKTTNAKIAGVDQKGNVTAITPGTAVISAVYGGKSYSCKVTVQTPVISRKSMTIYIGEKERLSIRNAKTSVRWSSGNNKIVKVDSSGWILAKSLGTTIITAKIGKYSLKCKVHVSTPYISAKKKVLGFSKSDYLIIGNCKAKVTWSSSNSRIVKVDQYGNIKAGKIKGQAVITAKFMGHTLKCLVVVRDTTYDNVRRKYSRKVLGLDTVWYENTDNVSLEYGETLVYPFQVTRDETIILSLFPAHKFKFAIVNTANNKVWERTATKETHFDVTLKRGVYKLLICKAGKGWNNSCSFRVVNKNASFLPFEDGHFTMNFVDGIEPEFLILNKWNKEIKYINFNLEFYNRVGDQEYDELGGYSSTNLRIIGPIKARGCGWYSWNAIFYNNAVYSMKITTAKITFMDGSEMTIDINKLYFMK